MIQFFRHHQARSLSTRALRPAFLAFNALVYAAEVALWLVAGLVHGDGVAGLVRVASLAFLAAVSLAAAAGFLIYGGRLFLMLRRRAPRPRPASWRAAHVRAACVQQRVICARTRTRCKASVSAHGIPQR